MARTAAWNDAEAKAEQLARLAGVNLRGAVSITESISYDYPPVYFEQTSLADGGASTPIEAGQQEVSVVIQVVFSIGS